VSFTVQIDQREPGGKCTSGYFGLRGWCLDEHSLPARELYVRLNGVVQSVSRQWRDDLDGAFPHVADSGWAGFLAELWLPFGFHRIEIVVGENVSKRRVLYRDTVWSTGIVRNPWSRTWSFENGVEREYPSQVAQEAVDVVGVFYQRPDLADRWFESLASARKELGAIKVFIVEHGPEPVVQDLVEEWSDRLPIEYVHNPDNPGFGAGCNAGASRGKAPYLFFLNPDAVLTPSSLSSLLRTARSNREEGFVGWEMAQEPWEHPKLYNPVTGETEWSSAAAWLLDRKAFERVEGFDEAIFLYGEDVDLSWRLRSDGGKLFYGAGLRVHHDSYGPGEAAGGKPTQIVEETRANAYLRGRHLGRFLGKYGTPENVRDHDHAFNKGLAVGRARKLRSPARSRFHGMLYEVERFGCSKVPLRSGNLAETVRLRVRWNGNGFSEALWRKLVDQMVGVEVELEVWDRSRPKPIGPNEWIFDAESHWLLFPDSLEQMLLIAKENNGSAVRGMGKSIEGEGSEELWRIHRFSDSLPIEDSGYTYRPGVLRKGDAMPSTVIPKTFWLQAERLA
tara:strand:- start:9605 stop:11293 length:1689 start_codon:yes stop_codon:yes gene_type:complete